MSVGSSFTLQKKQKLPMRQIHQKHSKFVGKLIVYEFIDGFLSPSIIMDGFLSPSVVIDKFKVNLSVNPLINLATDDIYR